MKKSNQLLDFVKSHKVLTGIICYVVIAIIVVGILNIGKSNNFNTAETTNVETTADDTNTTENTSVDVANTQSEQAPSVTEEHSYIDALRKCTVMEAADIYTTGIGKKSDNVFNDARVTCDGWYSDWGENDYE